MPSKRGPKARRAFNNFNRKSRRGKFGRRNRTRSSNVGVYSVVARRTFSLYPKVYLPTSGQPAPGYLWLDSLTKYGAIAARPVFIKTTVLEAVKYYMTSMVQTILIGIEDLVMDNPLIELAPIRHPTNGSVYLIPKLDFRQARLENLRVTITPGASVSQRGGMISATLIALTREESEEFQSMCPDRLLSTDPTCTRPYDVFTFNALQQFPRAVTQDASKTLVLSTRLSGFSSGVHRLGQPEEPVFADFKKMCGGPFLFKLCVGYEDIAMAVQDTARRFSPEEALFSIKIAAKTHFSEPGMAYLRSRPWTTMPVDTALVTSENHCGRVIGQMDLKGLDEQRSEDLLVSEFQMI